MGTKARKWAWLSTIYYKLNELEMNSENLEKIYVIGIKIVSLS
jgi:hypothetical protein